MHFTLITLTFSQTEIHVFGGKVFNTGLAEGTQGVLTVHVLGRGRGQATLLHCVDFMT